LFKVCFFVSFPNGYEYEFRLTSSFSCYLYSIRAFYPGDSPVRIEKFSLFSVPSRIGRRWFAALGCLLVLATGGTVAMAQTAAQFSYAIVPLGGGGNGNYATGLAVDGSGNLYVAYTSADAVKEIPAGCTSTSCVITLGGGFSQPGGVAVDGSGNVYVADTNNSAVKEMPAGCANITCVTTLGGGFNGPNGVAVDGIGNVYVADTYNRQLKEMPAGCANIACVTTVGGGFDQPDGVAVDGSGNIYVSDYHDDGLPHEVDEVMTRGVNFFTLPVKQSTTETLTFTFTAAGTIGAPVVLMQGAPNLDFVDAGTGSCTAQSYILGATCTVDVNFTPQYAGARHGAVNLVNSSGAVIATAHVYGTGTGPQVIYPSNHFNPIISALGSGGFTQPWGVALDGGGNIYVADAGGGAVKVMSPGCTDSTCVTPLGGGFTQPWGVAVDGGGNIYVADEGSGAVKAMPPGCISVTCVTTLGGGFTQPTGVAVDGIGNVYLTDNAITTVKEIPLGCTSAACVTTLGGGFSDPYGLAVDDNGNVFVADTFNDVVKKIPPGCTSAACVVEMGGGPSSQLYGVALDGIGNVYFIDNTPNGEEKMMPPNCLSTSCVTELGNDGVSVGLAVDASDNVYFADRGFGVVRFLSQNTPPSLTFASTAVGLMSSDSPQAVTVENIGNAPLSFPILSAGSNPSISTNFSFTASCAAPTALPVSSGGTTQTLAAGGQCTLSASFAPTVAGSITGTLVLTDDHLNAASPNYTTQTINLNGTGTAAVPDAPTNVIATAGNGQATVSFTSPASDGGSAIVYYTVTSAPGNISVTCNSSPCTIPGLTNGTSYTFTVTATNSVGTSSPSSASNSVTPSASPQTPTLSWGAPAAIAYGTPLSATQLDATATVSGTSVPGTFSYSPVASTVLSAGTHMLAVSFAPTDTISYAAPTPVTVSLTVTPASLAVAVNSATMIYGGAYPVLTGTANGLVNSDTAASVGLVYTTTPATTSTSTSAIYPITAAISSPNYTLNVTHGTLTITQAASRLALSASAGSVTPGQSLMLTAQVSDASSGSTGTPAGTVTFFDGTTQLGTGTLANGVANFSASTLAAGATHSLTASYSGDTNFMASDSSAATRVSVGASGFSFTLNGGGSQTVVQGSAASYNFQLSPTSGVYPGTVSFTATGLPAGATATFTPATVAANGGPTPVNLSIQTASLAARNRLASNAAPVVMALLLLPLAGARRMRRHGRAAGRYLFLLFVLLAGVAATAGLTGCGTGNGFFGHAPQTYNVTATATSGSISHSVNVTLNVE
jgi:hypothetical protein